MAQPEKHWKTFCGVELFKVEYRLKQFLYKAFGVTLPKLRSQHDYWQWRGAAYCDEILASGYLEREVFFQDLILEELRALDFASAFEAGCGFGWNLRRIKEAWPDKRVGGVDFSLTQLRNGRRYMAGLDIGTVQGDACRMPFCDGAFDVGFTLGVFMNIHPDFIRGALREMLRVCRTAVIHVEYCERHATPELVERRAFKTNIVSHDYEALYAELGAPVKKVLTHADFGSAFRAHEDSLRSTVDRWEGFEGPDKYAAYVIHR